MKPTEIRAGKRKNAMSSSLKGRDLITLDDFSPEEIIEIISLADRLKAERKACGTHAKKPLAGKSVVIYFEKQSLRTRASFEIGVVELGGHPVVMYSDNTHSERGEPRKDMARVLSRYAHGIIIRSYSHEDIVVMAEFCDAPVINALSDADHPCQALADLQTIYEKKDRAKKINVAYIGDANNVANSLMVVFAKVGINLTIACPETFGPEQGILERAEKYASESGACLKIVRDPREAVSGADIVYTDVWVSMGQEEESARRRDAFKGYVVDETLMEAARPEALFMHDLPAHRGEEVTDGVMESPRSIIFDQAENRLHAQKAVLQLLIGD